MGTPIKIRTGDNEMKYLLAIWIVIVLVGLLLISLINLTEFRVSGLIIAGISVFALYRVFRFVFYDDDADSAGEYDSSEGHGIGKMSDPLDYVIFGEIANEESWDEY